MTNIYYLLIFIFGLICGSFLNAVIYRLHANKSFLKGRSFCPHCQHQLKTKDLVPILSFIALKGRCRYCQKRICWQYPLVELGTALVFCLLFMYFGWSLEFIFYLIISLFLVIIFVYDFRYHLILDKVSITAIILALVFNLILGFSIISLLLGGLIGGGFFFLQFIVSKGKWIGGGDIRLGILMGFLLGWQKLLVAMFLAYFVGAIFSIVLIFLKKKKLKSHLPFGTFLTAGTFVALLWGQEIIDWYLSGSLVNGLY